MDFYALAREQFPYVRDIRRLIHKTPELSGREFATTALIIKELDPLGLNFVRTGSTGLYADMPCGRDGATVAMRADIDALPVSEMTGLEFSSQCPGLMHACGHDTHVAMLLGAMRILRAIRNDLPGRVRFLFQPSEETCKGAAQMIELGALDGVDGVFGLHIMSQKDACTVHLSSGAILPGAARFMVKVIGKATHGAQPEKGADATAAACAVVTELYAAATRALSPADKIVISVGALHSGTAGNIVSGEAIIEGTARAFDEKTDRRIQEVLHAVAYGVASAYGCRAEITYENLCYPLVNDLGMTELARLAALEDAGQTGVFPFGGMLASDDFAEFSARVPGVYAVIGGGGDYPQHSDRYFLEENAMIAGTALYAAFARRYLLSKAQ